MKSTVAILAGVLAGLAVLVGPGRSAPPKPSEVPVSWELEFQFEKPVAVRLKLPGQKVQKTLWYIRYSVANRTGEDLTFVPEFLLYTDTGQTIRAGQNTPAAAFEEIKKLVNDPLLRDVPAMAGKLLQGADNAKRGLAIWPDFDPKAGQIDLFIGGLSGETATLKLPRPITVTETDAAGKKVTVKKDSVILSKTLHLRYKVPGEAAQRFRTPIKLVLKEWVMR